jgi:hypothetical protein
MELEDLAHAMDARIVEAVPPGSRWGDYCNLRREIRLHPELGALQRRYVLAHELGHADLQHVGCSAAEEWAADVWAATWLIRRSEWAQATKAHDTVGDVATDLGFSRKLCASTMNT